MRELKRQMVYTICKDNERIRCIESELLGKINGDNNNDGRPGSPSGKLIDGKEKSRPDSYQKYENSGLVVEDVEYNKDVIRI